MVHQITHASGTCAAIHRRDFRSTEAQFCAEGSQFIPYAHLAESAESVTEVGPDTCPVKSIVRERIIFRVNLKSGVAGARVRRNEPLALCPEGAVQLGGAPVGFPKKKTPPPLRAESRNVH